MASFHTWKQLPATDGRPCQIRKGETALRVYAPIRTKRQELDEDTGETTEPAVVGYKLVPVFHQGQLVAPPDLPAQPKLLHGDDPPTAIWEAVAEQINAAGYALHRGPLDGPDGAKGVTNFIERTVTVRDDLAPAQALKTQIHELGHVLMHYAEVREPGMTRDRIEVEAESVAYVVCDLLGVDAGSYSIPYVANWAGADVELVEATAHKVLATARQIVTGLEAELGVDLRPNPIAAALNATPEPPVEPPSSRARRRRDDRPDHLRPPRGRARSTGNASLRRSLASNRIAPDASTTTPPRRRSCSPKPAPHPRPTSPSCARTDSTTSPSAPCSPSPCPTNSAPARRSTTETKCGEPSVTRCR